MSCETSNRLLTISFCNHVGNEVFRGDVQPQMSFWMNIKAWDVHLCLDALREHHSPLSWWGQCSLPHILSLSPSCFRDFCRCTGIVRSCLFLYSVPSLNSASCQASRTPHCWHHCESDRSYQRTPKGEQQHGQFECFLSLTASSPSLDCFPLARQNDEQSTAEVVHNRRKICSIWLAFPPHSWVILQLTVTMLTHIPTKSLRAKSMVLTMRPGLADSLCA